MKHKQFTLSLLLLISSLALAQKGNYKMIAGTYTNNTESKGIYLLEFNKKGEMLRSKLLAESKNPSYLTFSPDKKFLYAVNEHGEGSTVSAYSYDAANETLNFINKTVVGADPCYLTVTEKHIFTADYSGGSISVLKRNADGSVSDSVQQLHHTRKHFGNNRFGPSNVHQVKLMPDGEHIAATNLGTNMLYIYRYNPESDNEVLAKVSYFISGKMSGPRHVAISAYNKYIYLLGELSAGISVIETDFTDEMQQIQELSLVKEKGKVYGAADIHLTPNGRYLLASNRGDNNDITLFKVNKDGTLKQKKQYPVAGNGPRNFLISKDAKRVFVANQHSNNISVFKLRKCGKLKLLKSDNSVSSPVCLLPVE